MMGFLHLYMRYSQPLLIRMSLHLRAVDPLIDIRLSRSNAQEGCEIERSQN